MNALLEPEVCDELRPLHRLIRDKFMKIIQMAFQPIPTNPEYYFCLPRIISDKMVNMNTI